ncbi:MAG: PA14 domain-containing protein, partial [Candidatus Omnitrophica bacterium]|nr:PA14 domain-containing protein [Candidatus Omnitrophota bacterium]
TLTVSGVASSSGNIIKPNSRLAFSAWAVSPGFLVREVWDGISSPLANLKNSSRYPNFPSSFGYVDSFEAPVNQPGGFGQRLSGFLAPNATGSYTFYIAARDQGELYLSTSTDPAQKVLIAKVENGTDSREWNKEAGQKSSPIALEAGKLYYIEALQTASTSTNNLAVTWTLPGVTETPANGSMPISRDFLASFYNPDQSLLLITSQPKDVTVVKTQPASFSVSAFAFTTIFYQWQQLLPGASAYVDIDGATSPTYSIPNTTAAQDGTKFQAIVAIPGSIQTSAPPATLTVINDTSIPKIVSATAVKNTPTITLVFSEQLDPASANNPDNIVVFGGFTVISSVLQSDGKTVVLTVDKPLTTSSVVVWAWNIADLGGNISNQLTPVTIVSSASEPVVADGGAAKPMLTIQKAGDNVVVSWPNLPGAKFILESGTPAEGWSPVAQPVEVQGDKNTVTIPLDGSNKMYRLTK